MTGKIFDIADGQEVRSPSQELTYEGHLIHRQDEMLSLTDMWRAAGSPGQQTPAKWRVLPTAKSFVEHVSLTIGKSDCDLFITQNGGTDRGTWAHWHIAMAYAKYLDHGFHMWCNTVVRAHMEGRPLTSAVKPRKPKAAPAREHRLHAVDRDWWNTRMKTAGLSQRRLAKLVGMDHAALSLALSGKRHLRLQEAFAVADNLGVSVDELRSRMQLPQPKLAAPPPSEDVKALTRAVTSIAESLAAILPVLATHLQNAR